MTSYTFSQIRLLYKRFIDGIIEWFIDFYGILTRLVLIYA